MNRSGCRQPREGTWYAIGFLPGLLSGTEVQLEHLKRYLLIVSGYVESEASRFREDVEEAIRSNGLTEEAVDYYYDRHSEEFEVWQSFFPDTIRTTVLVSACSLLEGSLCGLCKDLESELEEAVSLEWAKVDGNNGVMRAAKFLRQNVSIHFEDHPNWARILDYYRLRNLVVHAYGKLRLQKKRDETEEILNRLNGTGVCVDYGQIQISNAFLDVVLKDMTTFWKALEKAFIQNAIVGPRFWP